LKTETNELDGILIKNSPAQNAKRQTATGAVLLFLVNIFQFLVSQREKQMIQRRFFFLHLARRVPKNSGTRAALAVAASYPQWIWIRKRVQKLEEREEAFNKRMKKTSF
jgi:hypothetical protein